jgi:hypothetical protein
MGELSPPLFIFRSIGRVETVDGDGAPDDTASKESAVVLRPGTQILDLKPEEEPSR